MLFDELLLLIAKLVDELLLLIEVLVDELLLMSAALIDELLLPTYLWCLPHGHGGPRHGAVSLQRPGGDQGRFVATCEGEGWMSRGAACC